MYDAPAFCVSAGLPVAGFCASLLRDAGRSRRRMSSSIWRIVSLSPLATIEFVVLIALRRKSLLGKSLASNCAVSSARVSLSRKVLVTLLVGVLDALAFPSFGDSFRELAASSRRKR